MGYDKLDKKRKIFFQGIIIICVIVLMFNSNTILAAINTEYTTVDGITNEGIDTAIEESTLLNSLAKLIYAVGRLLEWLLGVIFKLLTGSSDFPWADKIVFNAVPLLDVNFINSSAGSFVGNASIQVVLKNLYSTIMALAVGFFGIAVLITAIKLLISTIASEKAKYKQAVIDWLIGFVMIFCIHYFVSFVFYLNEQLVTVASKIVTQNLETIDDKVSTIMYDSYIAEIIAEAEELEGKYSYLNSKHVSNIKKNQKLLLAWLNNTADDSDGTKGLHEALFKKLKKSEEKDKKIDRARQYRNLANILTWASAENVSVAELKEIKNRIKVFRHICYRTVSTGYGRTKDVDIWTYNQAILAEDLVKIFGETTTEQKIMMQTLEAIYATASKKDGGATIGYGVVMASQITQEDDMLVGDDGRKKCDDNKTLTAPVQYKYEYEYSLDLVKNSKNSEKKPYFISRGSSKLGYESGQIAEDTNFYFTEILDDLIVLKSASDSSSGKKIIGSGTKVRIITDLASYFRFMAYGKKISEDTIRVTDTKEISIQNMIMYAVLVGQSLILFISYVKRLFYVIILAMMAPMVVVFDFFQKFGK